MAGLFSALTDPVALFLALVLASAAGHKLVATDRLGAAAGNLLGLAPPLARSALFAAAALEAVSALALVLPATRLIGAMLAIVLWAIYAAALLRSSASVDCGCSFSAHRHGIGKFDRMRPLALIVLASLVALSGPVATIPVEAVFAALALFSFYLAAGELAALPTVSRSIAR